jgi:hypothetical protein
MAKPSKDQLRGAFADIVALAERCNRDADEVLRRAKAGGNPIDALAYPAGSGLDGGGRGGSELTATERAADRWFPRTDDHDVETDGAEPANVIGPPPGAGADGTRHDGLLFGRLVIEAREAITRADACRRSVMELDDTEEVRRKTNELCAGCGESAPVVKRVHGAPYHPGDCYALASANAKLERVGVITILGAAA